MTVAALYVDTRGPYVGAGIRDLPDFPPPRAASHVVASLGLARRARARAPQLPEMPKALRHVTPPAFASWLVAIARSAQA